MSWFGRAKREIERLSVDEIVLADLGGQLTRNSQAQANMITRVAIAIAANGLVLVPLFADGVKGFLVWPGPLWLAPLVPAVLSISFGLKAIGLWESKAAQSSNEDVELFRSAARKDVVDRMIKDRLEVLESVKLDLQKKATWHRRSLWALASAGLTITLVLNLTTIWGDR